MACTHQRACKEALKPPHLHVFTAPADLRTEDHTHAPEDMLNTGMLTDNQAHAGYLVLTPATSQGPHAYLH